MKVEQDKVEYRLRRFEKTAKTVGIKMTHQRLEIFREIASSMEHPDAETVFRTVQKRIPTVSLDTVYRTLWMLHDLGLITTLNPRHESVRFDAKLERHHHYICARCGLVRDFEGAELIALRIPEAAKRFGSVVTTHIEARGICKGCAKGKAKGSKATTGMRPHGQKGRKKWQRKRRS
jgi:Fur family peroxide stress response transcriptional regulator